MIPNALETGLMLAIVATCAAFWLDERRREKKRRAAWKRRQKIAQWLWRQHSTAWVNQEAQAGNILMCIVADKESLNKNVTLVEFSCTRCSLKFYTEVGKNLAPACCPHCGMQFTNITKAPNNLCTKN